jgi:hypothetical protein
MFPSVSVAQVPCLRAGAVHAPTATHCAYRATVTGYLPMRIASTFLDTWIFPMANPLVIPVCPSETVSGISSALGGRGPLFEHAANTTEPTKIHR